MAYIDDSLDKILAKESLTFDEAKLSMNEIMNGEVSEVKLSSWVTALRMKGETAQEIAGCASIIREHASKIKCNDSKAVDTCGTGGDGAHTINISTTAAFVAAGAGVTVAKHGNKAVSSKSGSADLISALGIKIDLDPSQMEHCLNDIGIAFLFAPLLHPAMKYAMPVRRELGIRTIFNILGPLSNPADAKRAVLGVYDNKLCRLIGEAALNMGIEHMFVVHGCDGLDEITVTGSTSVCEVKNGSVIEYKLSPEDIEVSLSTIEELKGGTSEENAKITRDILEGKVKGAKSDIVAINAAAAIIAADKAEGWDDGIDMARESIASGAALAKVDEMVKLTNS